MRQALSFCLVVLSFAAVADVKGHLEVGGKEVQLAHAYALQYDNEENLIEGPELRILLTDREIDPSLLGTAVPMQLNALAADGKLCGVLLRSEKSDDGYALNGTIFYRPSDPRQSMIFFTHSGTEPVFKKFELKDGKVSGEVEEASDESGDAETAYKMNLTFSTPVLKRDPVTAHFKGDEAAASEPAKAFLAFENYCRQGDLESARKLSSAARMRQMDEMLKQMGKEAFVKEASQYIPETAKLRKQIVEVVVRGKRAVVLIDEDGTRNGADMLQDGDTWKIE